MNKAQRKIVSDWIGQLESLNDAAKLLASPDEARSTIMDIEEQIRNMAEEELDKFDNMPESFQNGERGDELQEIVGYLESAAEILSFIEFGDCTEEWADTTAGSVEDAADELSNIP